MSEPKASYTFSFASDDLGLVGSVAGELMRRGHHVHFQNHNNTWKPEWGGAAKKNTHVVQFRSRAYDANDYTYREMCWLDMESMTKCVLVNVPGDAVEAARTDWAAKTAGELSSVTTLRPGKAYVAPRFGGAAAPGGGSSAAAGISGGLSEKRAWLDKFKTQSANHAKKPAHMAAYHGQEDALRTLKELGVSLEEKDEGSWTPAHMAAHFGHEGALRTLKELGASLVEKDNRGRTPAEAAAASGQEGARRFLKEVGA